MIPEENYLVRRSSRTLKPEVRRGEPIASLLAGVVVLGLGLVELMSVLGLQPRGMPPLTRRATIVVLDSPSGQVMRRRPGNWRVPEQIFWGYLLAAVLIGVLGVALSRRSGRPRTCYLGLALQGLLMLSGIVLEWSDYQDW